MSASLSVAFGTMPLADAMLLRAALRLTGVPWHNVPRANCDVLFATDLSDLPRATQGGPRCVIAGPRRDSAVPAIFLDRWPNVSQLADVMPLLRAPRAVASHAHAQHPMPAGTAMADSQTPSPYDEGSGSTSASSATRREIPSQIDRWLDEVARAEARDRMLHVSTQAGPTALLDPKQRCAWLAPSATGRLAAAFAGGQVMLSSVPRSLPPATAVRASLAHVLWALALAGQWRPDTLGIDARRRLKLRRWPDFGSLERRETFLQVASRLTRQPTSLQALLAAHPKDRDDVMVFLAGCRLCGWLEETADIDDTPPEPAPVAPGRLQTAVGALRRALGIRGATR